MCLAIPVRITKISGTKGIGEVGGVSREADISFLEDLKVGDYVLLHAGFAIQKINEAEAEKTLKVWKELEELR